MAGLSPRRRAARDPGFPYSEASTIGFPSRKSFLRRYVKKGAGACGTEGCRGRKIVRRRPTPPPWRRNPAATLKQERANSIGDPPCPASPSISSLPPRSSPRPTWGVDLWLGTGGGAAGGGGRVRGESPGAPGWAKPRPGPRGGRFLAGRDGPAEVFIDYVPQRHARCVRPGDAVS